MSQDGFSRRGLLQSALTGVAALGLEAKAQAAPAEKGEPAHFDFTHGSGALEPDRVVDSACQFCNSLCRLKVQLKDGRVIGIKGETADPVQAGELCVKAELMPQLVYNRFRLTRPMRRVSGKKGSADSKFEPVSWDEALDEVARRMLALRDAGEARTIANRTSGRLLRGTGSLVGRLFELLGSPNDTDVGPVCNDAGGDALAATLGMGNFTNGYGVDGNTGKMDLGSSRLMLFLGTNQAETHPVTFAHLLRERAKRRAKLVVVDPRATPTSAHADVHLAPKPHTDMALVLGLLSHVIERGLYDKAFVAKWVLGFDELKAHLKSEGHSTEWAAGVTGIPRAQIEQLATDFATAKPAALFCNAGVSHQLGAFDTYRALVFLSAITGNIGVAGGGCNFMHNTWPGGLNLTPMQLPAGESLPVRGEALPVGPDWFSESVLTKRPYGLKMLITEGNPLLSSANTQRVRQAFEQLEYFVYTGLFMEESANYADLILPVCSGLEFEGVYMRRDDRGIRWQKQAVPRVGESRTDPEIWLSLAERLSKLDTKHKPAYWTDNLKPEWKDYGKLWDVFAAHTAGVGGMTRARLEARAEPLRWPCPTEKHPGTSTLFLDHPSWAEVATALGHQGKRFFTPSGKIEIQTPQLEARLKPSGHGALPRFYTHPEVTGAHPTLSYSKELVKNPINPGSVTPRVEIVPGSDAIHAEFPLMAMTGRSSVVHFAGVTQWTYLGKQLNGVRLIQIHPKVAVQHGVRNSDEIIVESPRGSIRGTALVFDGIREDTIFIPNTFGPAQAMGDEFGLPRYESINVLTDDRMFDSLSGQQAYKCFACRIKRA